MTREKTVITLEQLSNTLGEKVDNTGNVREWPSEEILAYYMVQRIKTDLHSSQNHEDPYRIIELGAGKSGLVGLTAACIMKKLGRNYEVVITDGNELCVQSLCQNVSHNMQQAARVSDRTAFFYLGKLIEYDVTDTIFMKPNHDKTEAYVSGRFG